MFGIEGLKDASMRGDERWYTTNLFTAQAPWLVLVLSILSMAEVALGAVWIIETSPDFGGFVQPIVIPGLSFFNALPSLNLHVVARLNPPYLALFFSTCLALFYFVSVVVYLASCVNASGHSALQTFECAFASGGNQTVWDVQVALQIISFIGYTLHAIMAFMVRRVVNRDTKAFNERKERGEETELDRIQKAKDLEEARERWKYISPG